MSTEEALPPGGGQPSTLEELLAALAGLPDLDSIERARIIPELSRAAQGVLATERALAVDEALRAPRDPGQPRVTLASIARELGIHRSKLDRLLHDHLPKTPS